MKDVLLERGRQGGNPARVALEGATENQLFGHDVRRVARAVEENRRTRRDCRLGAVLAATTMHLRELHFAARLWALARLGIPSEDLASTTELPALALTIIFLYALAPALTSDCFTISIVK
jgi:hypothetical protein